MLLHIHTLLMFEDTHIHTVRVRMWADPLFSWGERPHNVLIHRKTTGYAHFSGQVTAHFWSSDRDNTIEPSKVLHLLLLKLTIIRTEKSTHKYTQHND